MSRDALDFGRVHSEIGQSLGSDGDAIHGDRALFGDQRRLERLKQSVHTAIVWAVRIASISMLILFMVRVYHLAAPEALMWVSPERLQRIDSLLFSGFVGAFIARYLNQAMPASVTNKGK